MNMQKIKFNVVSIAAFTMLAAACNNATENKTAEKDTASAAMPAKKEYLSQPLVSHIYTADPSAHVFNGRIYVYPSHDTATVTSESDNGDHFNMMDYHVLSMDTVGGAVTDHG